MKQYCKPGRQDGFDDVRCNYKPAYKNKNAKAIMRRTSKHQARQYGKKETQE